MTSFDFLQAAEYLLGKGISPAYLAVVKKNMDLLYAFRHDYAPRVLQSGRLEENFRAVAGRIKQNKDWVRHHFTLHSRMPMGLLLLHLATISEEALREQWGFWQEYIVGLEDAPTYAQVRLPCTRSELEKLHSMRVGNITCDKRGTQLAQMRKHALSRIDAADIDWEKVIATIKKRLRNK